MAPGENEFDTPDLVTTKWLLQYSPAVVTHKETASGTVKRQLKSQGLKAQSRSQLRVHGSTSLARVK